MLEAGVCLPIVVDAGEPTDAEASLTCGPGTMQLGSVCVPLEAGLPVGCGAGTTLIDGSCYPTPPDPDATTFSIEVEAPLFGTVADGYSRIPILAQGLESNGALSTESMVLFMGGPNEGTTDPTAISLGALGPVAYYTPCNGVVNPACLNQKVTVSMARASAPTTAVASSTFIVEWPPTAVGTTAPCLAGGNVVYFESDPGESLLQGTSLLVQGLPTSDWSAWWTIAYNGYVDGLPGGLTIMAQSTSIPTPGHGQVSLGFSVYKVPAYLQVTTFEKADNFSSDSPQLDISIGDLGCNRATGRFQITDLQNQNGSLVSFTAAFEQHCDDQGPALRGCVHFEQ
jgi:hypothetical protein